MPKKRLHSSIISHLSNFVEYETIVDILHLSGDKHLATHFLEHGKLTEIVATTKKSVSLISRLFGYHLPFMRLTRLIMECPLAVVPMLPVWIGDLPPTLVEIRFNFKGSAEVWLRPLNDKDDIYVTYVCSGNSYTSESLRERFPKLEILHCVDEEVMRGGEETLWSDPMKTRFMSELPPSLTSLRLDGFYCASGRYPMLPSLEVLQHLDSFSMAVGRAPFGDLLTTTSSPSSDNLLKGSLSSASAEPSSPAPRPKSTPSTPSTRTTPRAPSLTVSSLAAFSKLTSLELRCIKYDNSAALFKFLTSLNTLLLDFDFNDRLLEDGRHFFEPPATLTSLSLTFALSEVAPLLPTLPAQLTSLSLKIVQDGTDDLALTDLPASITQLEIHTSNNAKLGELSGLPANLRILNLSVSFSKTLNLSFSSCVNLTTLSMTPEERQDFGNGKGQIALPKHSLTRLSTGVSRPLSPSELQCLPTSITSIEGCFSVDHTLLTRETQHWNDEIATMLIRQRFLSHLTLHKLHLTIHIDQRFLNSLPQTHMTDIVCSHGATSSTTLANALLFPPTLTKMTGITMSRPIDSAELPRELVELDATDWKWQMPRLACEDHAHSHEKRPKTPLHLLHALADLVSSSDCKKITPECRLPHTLKSIAVCNPTVTVSTPEQGDYSNPFYLPLLATAPHLERLCLHLGPTGEPFIAILPRTLTDLTLIFKQQGQRVPEDVCAEDWPPHLHHLRVSHGPLVLASLKKIIRHLLTLHIEELIISSAEVGEIAQDTEKLDSLFMRKHCRFNILPPKTHLKHTIVYTVQWNKQSLLKLPRGLQTAVLKEFEAESWSSARRDFGLWLPPTLTKLNIGHWPTVHPKSTVGLPRTLRELLVCATDFSTDSYRHLPPDLVCLSLYGVNEFGPEEADALPKALRSLSICSKRYKSGTFILFPQSLRRISFGDTEDEISETQLKHLPKSLLRVELGFPERHREEATFGSRLKAFAKVLKESLPSLVYFGFTRDPADNLLTVR